MNTRLIRVFSHFTVSKNISQKVYLAKIYSVKHTYINVGVGVFFQVHFTKSDYIDWLLKYKRFCEGRYL